MIQSPSRSRTWSTLSIVPSGTGANGSSSAPMWTAVGWCWVVVIAPA
jgi:hypothetical protein